MIKILNCITNNDDNDTNNVLNNDNNDTNMLYIIAVINNIKITWHLLEKNSNNKIMINNIYSYFKNLYNKSSIEIEHNEDINLYKEDLSKIINHSIDCLFIKVFFNDL